MKSNSHKNKTTLKDLITILKYLEKRVERQERKIRELNKRVERQANLWRPIR